MPRAFTDIAFTPGVQQAQSRYGSRAANRDFAAGDDGGAGITDREAEFIAARDSFYLATVSETGWPYVQHRGGPPGFLKVLDPHSIGFADFRGNVQYVSVGNLGTSDRVALILMDYANRRRLKIWGHARIVHREDAPGLMEALELPGYRARVERGIVITVAATDWNCPQHITPRFTEQQVRELVAPVLEENARLRALLDGGPAGGVVNQPGPRVDEGS